MIYYFIIVFGVLFFYGLSFGITSALVYGICWAFGIAFTWKLAIGLWFVFIILRSIFNYSGGSKK